MNSKRFSNHKKLATDLLLIGKLIPALCRWSSWMLYLVSISSKIVIDRFLVFISLNDFLFSYKLLLISLHSFLNVECDMLQAKQNDLVHIIGPPASKLSSNLTDLFSLQPLKRRDIIDLIYDRCSVLSKSIKLSLNLFSCWVASWIVSSIVSSVA